MCVCFPVLQWCHMSVMSSQITENVTVCLAAFSPRTQRFVQHLLLETPMLCMHEPYRGNPTHKEPVMLKTFSCHDVIMSLPMSHSIMITMLNVVSMQFLLLCDNSINVLRNKVNLHFLWPNHPHCAHYSKSALATGCVVASAAHVARQLWRTKGKLGAYRGTL